MLFYLIYLSTCYQIYNFKQFTGHVTLFINPFDIVDVNYSQKCAIFNKWDDISDLKIDVLLYVELDLPMFGKESTPRTYSFEPDSKLKGICFINNDYTIRLINNGEKNLSFDIYLEDYFNFGIPYENYFFISINDSNYELMNNLHYDKNEYNFDNSPFIYDIDKTGSKYILGIIIPIFVVINGALIFYMIIKGNFNKHSTD